MPATEATSASFLATVPLVVWDSNSQPERFGASGLAERTTQSTHIKQAPEV